MNDDGHRTALGDKVDPPGDPMPWSAPSRVEPQWGPPTERSTRPSTAHKGFVVLLLFAMVVAAAALAYLAAGRADEVYAARAELRYSIDVNASLEGAQRSLTSHARAIEATAVLEEASAATGVAIDELRDRISAQPIESSDVVQIESHAPSATEARNVLAAVLDSYLKNLPDGTARTNARSFLEARVAELDAHLRNLDGALAALPRQGPALDPRAIPDQQRLDTERQLALTERGRAQQALFDLALRELDSRSVVVLVPPYEVPDPVEPQPLRAAVFAGLIAAVFATAVAYVLLRRPALT